MQTRLSAFCDKLLEAGWLAALVLAPYYMNIYTHRMFEPDKACLIRSIAWVILVAYLIKRLERTIQSKGLTTKFKNTDKVTNIKNLVKGVDYFIDSPLTKNDNACVNTEVISQVRNNDRLSIFTKPSSLSTLKLSIFFPVLFYVFSYALSTATSSTPYASFWGGYDRLQGLYTFFGYFVIFFIAVTHIKTKKQLDRIISTMILTSVPLVAYGLIQRSGIDPVPWQAMDPRDRISATMGNPIFFAAYLILVVPLALTRLVKSIYKEDWLMITVYSILILALITDTVLAQSRGPLLGLMSGTFVYMLVFSWRERIKWLFKTLLITSITGGIFLTLFNLPHLVPLEKLPAGSTIKPAWNKTFGKLLKVPYLKRLGVLAETKPGSTGRTRMILWKGALKLITETPFRFMVGHGPESLATVFYRYHTKELIDLEGSTTHADRCHNAILDSWVNQGLIGLIAYLFLMGGIMYLGIRAIFKSAGPVDKPSGLSPPPVDAKEPASIRPDVHRDSPEIIGTSLRLRASLRDYNLILIALLAGIVSHFIETVFGIAIVSTNTYFWVYCAALYAGGVLKNSAVYSRPKPTPNLPGKTTPTTALPSIWYYIFWLYAGTTLLLNVVLVTYYWPDERTNVDYYIIGSYVWLLAGILCGALALPSNGNSRERKTDWRFGNSLIYLTLILGAVIIIYITNLNPIRADGAYKFCFSYDMGAERFIRNNPRPSKEDASNAFNTRLASIPFYLTTLRLAPKEKTYLNGAARNFLEMAKLDQMRSGGNRPPDERPKLNGMPTIKEITRIEIPVSEGIPQPHKSLFAKFTHIDFFYCSLSCISDAYRLEPNNFERIMGMIRIYRYWGQLTGDITKYQEALELCRLAMAASPVNPSVTREINDINLAMDRLPPQPPAPPK
ncbi:MAG: O-antigen ligase family protein [Planctomycetes bacterium]|nr:O-antigen ligase family protein [Planctomycetota bacterium]